MQKIICENIGNCLLNLTGAPALVFVLWEDSAQPTPSWQYLEDLTPGTAVLCQSVGWLVHDDDELKILTPNKGAIKEEPTQICGTIRIPARAIVKIHKLDEPAISS